MTEKLENNKEKIKIMDKETKLKIIDRYDLYYEGTNNKSSFLLAFNTFLIGALLIGYKDLNEQIGCYEKGIFNIIISLIFILSITSMLITIFSIIPYLKKGKTKSALFFIDISESKENCNDLLNNISQEKLEEDISNQIYVLAKGLKKKYSLLKTALILNIFELLFLIPVIYFIIF